MEVKYYHTTGASAPNASNLELGEIALSLNDNHPKIFFKKNNGNLAEIVDSKNALLVTSSQTITEQQKQTILNHIGFCDETITLYISFEGVSRLSDVIVTVQYDTTETIYSGLTEEMLVFNVPMYKTYTVSFNHIDGYYEPIPITRVAKRNGKTTLYVEYDDTSYIDLSLKSVRGETLAKQETANCYVIHENGKYEFPLVYGCAIMSGKTNTTAYTNTHKNIKFGAFYNYVNQPITSPYIEEDTKTQAETTEIIYNDEGMTILSDFSFNTRNGVKYLRFQVKSINTHGGNTIIGIKDKSGQIMWSWHIWLFPFSFGYDDISISYHKMLPYNLGWVQDPTSSLSGGTCPYYQWGRKDPMLRAQRRNSNIEANVHEGSFNISGNANSIGETIQNPNVFFKASENSNGNWIKNGDENITFWNYWDIDDTYQYNDNHRHCSIKTIYDPCPVGYKAPSYYTLQDFSHDKRQLWTQFGYKYYVHSYDPEGEEPEPNYRHIPAVGYRDGFTGSITGLSNTETERLGVYFYSASHETDKSLCCYFDYDRINYINTDTFIRACGFPIIPITLNSHNL